MQNKELEDISTDWAQYKSLDFTSDNQIMNDLIEEILLGLERSCKSIIEIKNNDVLTTGMKEAYKTDFHQYDYSISVTISDASLKNEYDAKQLYNQIGESYIDSIIVFVVLFIISIILISFVATVLTEIVKKSIRSFTRILDTLASGDFTVDINTNEKSEIGVMKKALSATIKSISHILELIKNGSILPLVTPLRMLV